MCKNKFVDKTGRKPSGWLGKRMYSNPRAHYTSFRLTLDKLQLKPDDIFLEIGGGGGVLLNMALETVKHAKAIDHSSDMVQIAIEKNQKAVSEGRVEIVQGNAESLPWGDNSFTCAAAANVFFFIEKPMVVLKELYRVLKPGGYLLLHQQRIQYYQNCCLHSGLIPCISTKTQIWNPCLSMQDFKRLR